MPKHGDGGEPLLERGVSSVDSLEFDPPDTEEQLELLQLPEYCRASRLSPAQAIVLAGVVVILGVGHF